MAEHESKSDPREQWEQALASDPDNPQARVQLAQFEARAWLESSDEATLARVLEHLERALVRLPPQQHEKIRKFADELNQREARLDLRIDAESHPRLNALLRGEPARDEPEAPPAGAAAAQAEPAATAEAPSAPESEQEERPSEREIIEHAFELDEERRPGGGGRPPETQEKITGALPGARAAAKKSGDPSSAAAAPSAAGPSVFPSIDVGPATPEKLREWIEAGDARKLAAAYPQLTNLSTRRTIADKIVEIDGDETIPCLIHLLAHSHDKRVVAEITEKLLGLGAETVARQLEYHPEDAAHKAAVTGVLARIASEACREPLERALEDGEAEVRMNAVRGLTALHSDDAEWAAKLGQILTDDPEADVRKETAQALQRIGTAEAWQAMEEAARRRKLDEEIQPIYDAMRKNKGKRKTEETDDKKPGLLGRLFGRK